MKRTTRTLLLVLWAGGALTSMAPSAAADGVFVTCPFSFQFTNTSDATQTFVSQSTLALDPWQGGTLMGADINWSLVDGDGDGMATIASAPGTPVVACTVDSALWLMLLQDPFTFSLPPSGVGPSSGSAAAGLPGAGIAGPNQVAGSMAVTLTLTLSAGDRVVVEGEFIIELVPAAGPVALLAPVLVAAGRRRRMLSSAEDQSA